VPAGFGKYLTCVGWGGTLLLFLFFSKFVLGLC
jgi:hypothetical protein